MHSTGESEVTVKNRYLEVTYRNGKPIAAYFYLPREPADLSVCTEQREEGLLIDFSADGRAIGVEITSPASLSPASLNRALAAVNQEPATGDELAPLAAA